VRPLSGLHHGRYLHDDRRQCRTVLGANNRAQQRLIPREFRSVLLQQHGLATIHVHAAGHAAIAVAEIQGNSRKRAAEQHEQK